jgi:hypothetical protein
MRTFRASSVPVVRKVKVERPAHHLTKKHVDNVELLKALLRRIDGRILCLKFVDLLLEIDQCMFLMKCLYVAYS